MAMVEKSRGDGERDNIGREQDRGEPRGRGTANEEG